jgi:S1-C subfamily serine protease
MRRHFSGWTVLLLLAILFVLGLLWVRSQPQKVEDPLADAQQAINEKLGFLVEQLPGPKGGLLVQRVTPNTPAARMGLKVGDRVLAVNERSVWQAVQLQDLLAEKLQKGMTVLLLEREGTYRQALVSARAVPGAEGFSSSAGQGHEH